MPTSSRDLFISNNSIELIDQVKAQIILDYYERIEALKEIENRMMDAFNEFIRTRECKLFFFWMQQLTAMEQEMLLQIEEVKLALK